MFGNMGDMLGLLRNAGKLKQSMEQMQERLSAVRVVGEAGGGQARVTVNGRGEVLDVKLEPQLIQSGDVELVEEMVAAACRDAISRSRQAMESEFRNATGGLDLPGLSGLFGEKT